MPKLPLRKRPASEQPPKMVAAGTDSLPLISDHSLVQKFRLVVVRGTDEGVTFKSKGERTVIGTHESADFALTDSSISRFHCELVVAEGRVLVRDLGSRNGTFVNGVSVREAYLNAGSPIALGRTELRFDLAPDQVSVPLHERERFGSMVGRSSAMRRIFSLLARASESDATVVLEGETGTGKEVAAESIHRESVRRDAPFIVVDCTAIPSDLLESELFGSERGAFTGATSSREGAFELAQGGTVFLDEIGELALDLQPKLLRVIERREIKRLGGKAYVPVDVRIIAATNRNLRVEVNARRFRADLYYRLAVLEATLPPLRSRAEDLPLLVDSLLRGLGALELEHAQSLRTESFYRILSGHGWPGNVRELRNYLERCVALRESAPLRPEQIPRTDGDLDLDQPLKSAREQWSRLFERRYLELAMKKHDGNVTAAARSAEVDRVHFYRLLWRYGLR